MRTAVASPRLLLRRLRDVMAEPISAQSRLDKVVSLIAGNMVAEVCSVYLMRADDCLELYATEGLNPEAVHNTILEKDEGLVGFAAKEAKPINLRDAQAHPKFSYHPETGEDPYHGFLAVPILRAGVLIGVLVVQNKTYRVYAEDEVEVLQTTAMVLAELIASTDFKEQAQPGLEPVTQKPLHLQGVALNKGIGLGYVILHEPRAIASKLVAMHPEVELKRLHEALEALRHSLDKMLSRTDVSHQGDHKDVLDSIRLYVEDKNWIQKLREAIYSGLTAEAAVERVQSDTRARWMRQSDPYLRERLHDFDDLAYRLMKQLTQAQNGEAQNGGADNAHYTLPENSILVARHIGAAALLDYPREKMRGLVLEEGALSSHVSIIARALGLPCVGQIQNITGLVDSGDAIIVDGDAGHVHLRPPQDVEHVYADKVRFRAKRQEKYAELKSVENISKDGQNFQIYLNSGLLVDMPYLEQTGADGIGLFRTELQFMVSHHLPRTDQQQKFYTQVLDIADNRPVTFRTLDIGGDKILPYLTYQASDNPALGWRAIRLTLEKPALLKGQIRALLKAAAGRDLRIMFPMIANCAEFRLARQIVERQIHHLKKHNHKLPSSIKIGSMVEVPSLLFELDCLMQEADFLSVGSNDLLQFFYAADREQIKLANRYDGLDYSALHAFKHIVTSGQKHQCEVTVCGEMAARPIDCLGLFALGFRKVSVSPAAYGAIKMLLLETDFNALQKMVDDYLAKPNYNHSFRDVLETYVAEENLPI